tara:strand:+ start:1210 stop:1518 length:309 start_codon:yes stop_codon:yes gene_type:complete
MSLRFGRGLSTFAHGSCGNFPRALFFAAFCAEYVAAAATPNSEDAASASERDDPNRGRMMMMRQIVRQLEEDCYQFYVLSTIHNQAKYLHDVRRRKMTTNAL